MEGFEIKREEITIRIKAEQEGKTYDLIHHLREPNPSEWKEYSRRASKTKVKRGRVEIEGDLAAAEYLYDRVAIRVEGYLEKGEALSDIKRVPIIHKQTVIREFGNVWAEDKEENGDEEEKGKNSESAADAI